MSRKSQVAFGMLVTVFKIYIILRCPHDDFPVCSRQGCSCQVCFTTAISEI